MRITLKAIGITLTFCLLVAFNLLLLRQNSELKDRVFSKLQAAEPYLLYSEGDSVDVRGTYTYPGLGEALVPKDASGRARRAPLTLAVFLSSATECPDRLSELDLLKRLNDSLIAREQLMFAVAALPDSASIRRLLDSVGLDIPLVVDNTNNDPESITFEQMGISQFNMPFKVVFDANFTSVYMRGSNNSLASQSQFERAVLRLSLLAARGEL